MSMTGDKVRNAATGSCGKERPSPEAVILAEYQHRVANDLGVALSALAQARRQVVGLAASTIEGAAERISETVRLQRLLAPPTRRSTVDLAKRIEAVCTGLDSGRFAGTGTRIMSFVEPVAVDARVAWVASVIVAELVTNAGKHALPLGGSRIVVEIDGPGSRRLRRPGGLRRPGLDARTGVGRPRRHRPRRRRPHARLHDRRGDDGGGHLRADALRP